MWRQRSFTVWAICGASSLLIGLAAVNFRTVWRVSSRIARTFRATNRAALARAGATPFMNIPAGSQAGAPLSGSPTGAGLFTPSPAEQRRLAEAYGRLPLSFEINRGQIEDTEGAVKFLARGREYMLFLTSTEAVFSFPPCSEEPCGAGLNPQGRSLPAPQTAFTGVPSQERIVRMMLVGANPAPRVMGLSPLRAKVNYFKGNNPQDWHTGIPTYAKVRYEKVYPGIDLVFYGNQQQLEYDFVVAPGANPGAIRLTLEGQSKLRLNTQGDLLLGEKGREIRFLRPRLYQQVAGERRSVAGRYRLMASRQVGFEVGAYDQRMPLMIDPVLTYSTYLGTPNYDQANGIAVDSSGNAYVTGFTVSTTFPVTSGALKTTNKGGYNDAFVTKFSPGGSSLVYSTYLGGSLTDQGTAIAVDSSGNAYIAGETISTDFPTTVGSVQRTYGGGGDAFVAKLSSDGSSLLYSTYFGGSAMDLARGIAIDSLDDIYITGTTYSTNLPTLTMLQPSLQGTQDAFVAEIGATGSLVYSTYLGGSNYEQSNGIAVDSSGDAYVTGYTNSPDFPTANAIQGTCKSCPTFNDAFVTEIGANGVGLVYSTYLGGSGDDAGAGIAVDAQGNAYLTGFSFSTDFPATAGAFQQTLVGGSSAILAKIAPNGTSLIYATYLGADAYTMGQAIAILNGNAYITGLTHANSFPLVNPTQSTRAGFPDAFVAEVNNAGTALYYSSYLGGNDRDDATAIALDSAGNAYVSGLTHSTNFPVVNPYQATNAGGDADVFLTKIQVSPTTLSTNTLTYSSQIVGTTSAAQQVTVTNNGSQSLTITGVTTTGANGGDFSQTNTCGTPLSAGATCTVQVSFSPSVTGAESATLNVATDLSGSPPQAVSLTGTGIQPVVTFTPSSLSFSSQQVGTTSAAQTVTISNTGTAALTITGISITGTNSGDFAQANNCPLSPATLAANANCTMNVTFSPTANGTRSAAVSLTDNAPGSPQTVSLSGTGAGSTVTLTPASLSFGNQQVGTTSVAQAVTLTNTSSTSLTITSVGITGTNSGDFAQTNNCPLGPATLAANANCTINVAFTPTAIGARSAALSIADDAPGSPQTASLSGTGTAPAVNLAPSSLSFGNQLVGTTSAAQTATLTNTGTAPLTILSVGISGTNSGDFAQTNNCPVSPSTLAVNTSCTVSVTFGPTAMGTRTAAVIFTDNASDSPEQLSLTGTGIAPVAGLSPASLTYATQQVGTTSAAQTVILSNTGTATMSITSISIVGTNGADFAQGNNCGASLVPGANCSINVTFTPTMEGTETAALAVTDNASGSPQSVSLTGTGSATVGAPIVSLSPTALAFGTQNVGTTSAAQTVTLSNTGSAALSISSIAVTGTNSGDFAETDNCGTSVTAGTNCTINVTFTPAANGTRTAALAISDNASGSPQTVSLTGTGVTPSAPSLVQVQNNMSTTTTAFTSFSVNVTTRSGDLLVAFCRESSNGTDNFTVADSAGQTWTQTSGGYKNESSTGPRIGMFYVANSAAVTSVTVNFTTAGGVVKPGIMVFEISGAAISAVADGAVNGGTAASTTTSKSGSLTTTSANDILIFGTDTSGDETGWTSGAGYTIPNNGVTIGASGSNVRMAMQYAVAPSAQVYATGLTYTKSNWNGNIFAAFKAATLPPASLAPSSLTFANQTLGTASAVQAIALINGTNSSLTISSIAITGTNSGDFTQTNNCGTTLAPGASCSLDVTFVPSIAGTENATLTVADSAANSPQSASLTGTGTPVGLTPASLTFNGQTVGTTSASQTVMLSNVGNTTINIAGISIAGTNSGDFAQSNTCGTSVAAGASCTISVTFTPTATGTRTGAVTITDDASGSPQQVPVTGTGI